jgi:hypothetical protein
VLLLLLLSPAAGAFSYCCLLFAAACCMQLLRLLLLLFPAAAAFSCCCLLFAAAAVAVAFSYCCCCWCHQHPTHPLPACCEAHSRDAACIPAPMDGCKGEGSPGCLRWLQHGSQLLPLGHAGAAGARWLCCWCCQS